MTGATNIVQAGLSRGHCASGPSKAVAAARQTAGLTSQPDGGPRAEDARTKRLGTRGDHKIETEAITNLKIDRRGKLRSGKVRRPPSPLGCDSDSTACVQSL